MGKRLIIKGADFSENGIPVSEIDITNFVFSEVIQGGRNTDGSIDTKNTRVSSPIVYLSSIGAKAGDKIVIDNDNVPGLLFGFLQGVSGIDLSGSESHWYSSNKGNYTGEVKNNYVITDYAYMCVVCGKANNNSASAKLLASDVQGFIDDGILTLTLVKADE